MKRTKKETRENYLAMMTEMHDIVVQFHLRDMIEKYNVSANIGSALLECKFISKSLIMGRYRWIHHNPTMSDVEKVLSILKSRNKPAPEVVEVSDAVGAAYPKKDIENAIYDPQESVDYHEGCVLTILGNIMRDNKNITYTLKRIEREVKETETTIL